MCGIVGYVGHRPASDLLLEGLSRLEYRGYDSAGIAVVDDSEIEVRKRLGRVAGLIEMLELQPVAGSIGIGHTRWATHGEPNDKNAHPHFDQTGKIALIHNGIIENYSAIKKVLVDKGIEFKSDTDTEVLVQLISDIYYADGLSFEQAVQTALNQVIGTYGIATFCSDEPKKLLLRAMGVRSF